jgi:hypothetical protein
VTGPEIDAMLDKMRAEIDAMSQFDMARLWRNAPAGHAYFQPPLGQYFEAKFKEKGGFTPEISKAIGFKLQQEEYSYAQS